MNEAVSLAANSNVSAQVREEADPGTCKGDPEYHVLWKSRTLENHVLWKSRTQQIRKSSKIENSFLLRIFVDHA
jgi:hypothetical protein